VSVEVTLFTVDEANRVAAEIRPELERLVEMKREFDRIESRAAVLDLASHGAAPGNPDAAELERLRSTREALGERIGRAIRALQGRGCLVKDLDRGLVDFYSLHGDRLIFLCWQLAETEVAHWHTLEAGFAGRQPIQASEAE
jgi:hypothetical protein